MKNNPKNYDVIYVDCEGEIQNQQLHRHLQGLGYTYLGGEPLHIEKLDGTFFKGEIDGKRIPWVCYEIYPSKQEYDLSSVLKMRHRQKNRWVSMSLEEYIEYAALEQPEQNQQCDESPSDSLRRLESRSELEHPTTDETPLVDSDQPADEALEQPEQSPDYSLINVSCEGKRENQRLLQRLHELGYTYIGGREIKPEEPGYNCTKSAGDGKTIECARYCINTLSKQIAYNNYMAMMSHELRGTPSMTVDEFLQHTTQEQPLPSGSSANDSAVQLEVSASTPKKRQRLTRWVLTPEQRKQVERRRTERIFELEPKSLDEESPVKHVICIGHRQNKLFLERLQKQRYVFSGGAEADPHWARYTVDYLDEDGATTDAAVYIIDEQIGVIGYHNSESLLRLCQNEDRLLSFEEYINGKLDRKRRSLRFRWKEAKYDLF